MNAGCTTSNLDWDKVLEEVFDAKAKWKFIGLKLGVPKGVLDAIQMAPVLEKKLWKQFQ